LVESVTVTSPGLAGPLRVTVPVADRPAATLVGETDTPVTEGGGGSTRRLAVVEASSTDAFMVACVAEDTGEVVTVNVSCVEPADTVTLDGTAAQDEFEMRFTVSPPEEAACDKEMVPVALPPPMTYVAESVSVGCGI
jgi:hypothetical protein